MNWDEMHGDERERFCVKCKKTVFNLSRMTDAERAALLAAAQPGQLCVAYYQRLSGRTRAPSAATHGASAGTLIRIGGAAVFLAAIAAVANQATRESTAAADAGEAWENAYDAMRYHAEEWVDNMRVFFGAEPKYSNMVLGAVCEPPSSYVAPMALPEPESAMSPAPTPEPSSSPSKEILPAGDGGG